MKPSVLWLTRCVVSASVFLAACSSTPLTTSEVAGDKPTLAYEGGPATPIPPGAVMKPEQSLILGQGDQWVGRMVLDRTVDNFFAETEQVAFHPGHLVPGIDFTSDPLLQGRLNRLGVPAGSEFLDVISPQYIGDLISWGAIGARTTESQVHRELASGLSAPVGFKNGTDGNIRIATDAIQAAARGHHFLSVHKNGQVAIVQTQGNKDCHVILRGGKAPNYDAASVAAACKELDAAGLPATLMVDCSHANSSKQHQRQIDVAKDIAAQMAGGSRSIFGVMVESHLVGGARQLGAVRVGTERARQQRHIHQAHHIWLLFWRGEVGGECQAHRLRDVDARAHEQEGKARGDLADPGGNLPRVALAGQHEQREGHDGEAAEKQTPEVHGCSGHAFCPGCIPSDRAQRQW